MDCLIGRFAAVGNDIATDQPDLVSLPVGCRSRIIRASSSACFPSTAGSRPAHDGARHQHGRNFIPRAEPGRRERGARIIRAAFAAQPRLTSPSSALRETAESVSAKIAAGGGIGAFAGGALVAAILWETKAGALHVGRVSVAPAWRGRRLAGALIKECESEARRRGLARMTLRVRLALPENESAVRTHGLRAARARRPRRIRRSRTPGGDGEAARVTESVALDSGAGTPHDRPQGACRQLARARPPRGAPGRGSPRSSRPMLMGSASPMPRRRCGTAGARVFFVAHLSEGIEARRLLPG